MTTPGADTPTKTSAPSIASANVRALRVGGELVQVVPVAAAPVDNALDVAEDEVPASHAEEQEEDRTREARGTRAREHHSHFVDSLSDQLERVQEAGARHDRRAVLVVVEDGNVAAALAFLLDEEAVRRPDVLEVDAAEGRRERTDDVGEACRVALVDLDVECVDVGEALEQDRLPFHDGLRRRGADIAEAEHGGAVRDHADEVAA